jgi:hippurate hydrolase
VLSVGRLEAGTESNVIPGNAVIELNVRTYSEQTRTADLDAIKRIADAEREASGSPEPADDELFDRFPLTDSDPESAKRVAAAFSDFFVKLARPLPMQMAKEGVSDIPSALEVPYRDWGIGGTDPQRHPAAEEAGRADRDIHVNYSASFLPARRPTLDAGVQAMIVTALAWLAQSRAS